MKYLAFIFSFLSFYSHAETQVFEEFQFYEVAATSKSNLLKTINRASPIRQNGEIFHGFTKYNIKWRFWWKSNGNKCAFTKVETTLRLKYTLPQLKSSDPEVKTVWSNWYPNLEKHEKSHGKLAKDIANEIDSALLAISPKTSCSALEKSGNKVANKLMNKLEKANKNYDSKTNHGETEKAWLYLHL